MKWKLSIEEKLVGNYGKELIKARGVDDIEGFLKPHKDLIQNPADLDNIVQARMGFLEAMQSSKKILLIVDSDVDGFTSSAIIYQYIKDLDPNKEIEYLLHSGKEHGLEPHIEKILEKVDEYALVILPDSSSNDYKYHLMLDEYGVECLVLDHHEKTQESAPNLFLVNNQTSLTYRNKSLTGAGVALQFCRYLDKVAGTTYADKYFDLAALGIVGDMGSMLEIENRTFCALGIHYPTENFFLQKLYEKQNYSITRQVELDADLLDNSLAPIPLAFYVVPPINAMIRFGRQEEKERMFQAFIDGKAMVQSAKRGAKPGDLEMVAVESVRECTNARARQNKQKTKMEGELESLIHKHDLLDNAILFVVLDQDNNFAPELRGLVAMGLSKRYQKPAILAKRGPDGMIKGSGRGLNDSELKDFRGYLEGTGLFEFAEGHANAFGISIPEKNLAKFLEVANEDLKDIDFGEGVYAVDFIRNYNEDDINRLISNLYAYRGLWGQQNPEPLILIKDIPISKNGIHYLGAKKDTIKFESAGVEYICFQSEKFIKLIEVSHFDSFSLNVIGRPNINEWLGKFTAQLIIEDVELAEENFDF